MKKIVLLLISISTISYTMEKEKGPVKELQVFEKKGQNLASISTSSEAVLENLEEMEEGTNDGNATREKSRGITLTPADLAEIKDETKNQERTRSITINLAGIEENKEQELTHEELADNFLQYLFGDGHKQKNFVKPLGEKFRKISPTIPTLSAADSREKKVQEQLGILRSASLTQRSTQREKKPDDKTPTSITSYIPPESDLTELKKIASDMLAEHNSWQAFVQKILAAAAVLGPIIVGGITAGITAAAKNCPK